MKKIIAISVMFVLLTGAAFAVDLGGSVIGTVNLVESSSADGAKINGSATMNELRIEGSGEAGDGKFGGWYRFDAPSLNFELGDPTDPDWEGPEFSISGVSGNAWWKPIDQVKLIIGSNGGDGFYAKEGVAGWMFNQTVNGTGVGMGGGNVWGGGYAPYACVVRQAFFGGDGGENALRLEIKPIDMLGINIKIPYFVGGELSDIFKNSIFQIDVNLDFGNIALTYKSGEDGNIYLFYGGAFGDLGLDFGFHYDLAKDAPIALGLGLKYATDAFGVKFRTIASLAGGNKETNILAEVMPFFPLGDNLTAFVSAGVAMQMPDGGDTLVGWHFNPYLQIGEEWGAKFLVGIKVYAKTEKDADTNWSVPIAVSVGF